MRHHASTHLLLLDDPRLAKACCGQMRALLGGRMHPMIFAAASGTPVVGLAYNPKFHGLAELIDLDDGIMDVATLQRDGGPSDWRHWSEIPGGPCPLDADIALGARQQLRAFLGEILAQLPAPATQRS